MLSPIITEDELKLWNEVADHCHRAVVTAHAAPDGDAVGSSLALAGYLRSRGIEVKVVLPDIMSGIISGFMLAFTLSLDDFVITHFVKGPGFETLSTKIYTEVRKGIKPEKLGFSYTFVQASLHC